MREIFTTKENTINWHLIIGLAVPILAFQAVILFTSRNTSDYTHSFIFATTGVIQFIFWAFALTKIHTKTIVSALLIGLIASVPILLNELYFIITIPGGEIGASTLSIITYFGSSILVYSITTFAFWRIETAKRNRLLSFALTYAAISLLIDFIRGIIGDAPYSIYLQMGLNSFALILIQFGIAGIIGSLMGKSYVQRGEIEENISVDNIRETIQTELGNGKRRFQILNDIKEKIQPDNLIKVIKTFVHTPNIEEVKAHKAKNTVVVVLLTASLFYAYAPLSDRFNSMTSFDGFSWEAAFYTITWFIPFMFLAWKAWLVYGIARFEPSSYRVMGILLIVGTVASLVRAASRLSIEIGINAGVSLIIAILLFNIGKNLYPNYKLFGLKRDHKGDYAL